MVHHFCTSTEITAAVQTGSTVHDAKLTMGWGMAKPCETTQDGRIVEIEGSAEVRLWNPIKQAVPAGIHLLAIRNSLGGWEVYPDHALSNTLKAQR